MNAWKPVGLLVALAGLGAWIQPALAQNALGDGTALDKNLRAGSKGKNERRRDASSELQFRNAVVTGNAPGGMSFRGDVGYRAPGEFLGELGSNDSFSFRRDSVYSGLAGLGIRGTDALQYQFALTTGSTPPSTLAGTGVVARSGSGARLGTMTGDDGRRLMSEAPAFAPPSLTDLQRDDRGLSLWTLRSPSAFVANRDIQPSLMGLTQGPDGQPYGVTASTLRGLAVQPFPANPLAAPTGRMDTAAPTGVTQPGEAPAPVAPAVTPTKTPYDEFLDQLKAMDEQLNPPDPDQKPAEDQTPQWEQRLEDLRRQLEGGVKPEPKPGQKPAPDEKPDREGPKGGFDQSTIEVLRGMQDKVKSLAAQGVDSYARHMQAGQRLLAEGRYFDAEERFTTALAVKPGDTMAAVGRMHSQLGASMFLSASVNLQSLLVAHPELAAIRYGAEVLPKPERLAGLVEQLTTMAKDRESTPREAALLLAYVGFQFGNDAAREYGLETMSPAGSVPADGGDQLDRLAALLKELWAAGDAKPEK